MQQTWGKGRMEVYLQSCLFHMDDIWRKPYSEMKRSGIELPHGLMQLDAAG